VGKTGRSQTFVVWRTGHWSLLLAVLSLALFFLGALPFALLTAPVALILGIRGREGLVGRIGVYLSALVLVGCAFFYTPLYYLGL